MNLPALLLSLLLPLHAADAPKKTPATRAQLESMAAKLKTSPGDDALRRDIIALAQRLKPAPALPEEAKRRMVRGGAAVKGAKDPSDWRLAAEEFAAAALAAPWSGEAYYNLAVAQDKAAEFDAALRSLALAELALPKSEDVKTFRYEVEFRKEKSPEARARKDKDFIRSLEGARYETPWTSGLGVFIKIVDGQLTDQQERREPRVCVCADESRCGGPIGELMDCGMRVTLNGRKGEIKYTQTGVRYEVAEDGESIVGKSYWMSKWDDIDHPMDTRVYKRKR